MPHRNWICVNSLGVFTVVLDNRLVLQGRIVHDKDHNHGDLPKQGVEKANEENECEFIEMKLTCDAGIVRDDGILQTISPPVFVAGDIVRIFFDEIAVIGPSKECPPGPAPS